MKRTLTLWKESSLLTTVNKTNIIVLILFLFNLGNRSITSAGSRISNMGGDNPRGSGANLLFGKIFGENCMKMK